MMLWITYLLYVIALDAVNTFYLSGICYRVDVMCYSTEREGLIVRVGFRIIWHNFVRGIRHICTHITDRGETIDGQSTVRFN